MSHNQNYSKFSKKQEPTNLEEVLKEDLNDEKEENVKVNELEEKQENETNYVLESNQNNMNVENLENVNRSNYSVKGVIINCDFLRVRSEPTAINGDTNMICLLGKDNELMIDLDSSTDDFYKVKTVDGVEGYCMKKFINIQ